MLAQQHKPHKKNWKHQKNDKFSCAVFIGNYSGLKLFYVTFDHFDQIKTCSLKYQDIK